MRTRRVRSKRTFTKTFLIFYSFFPEKLPKNSTLRSCFFKKLNYWYLSRTKQKYIYWIFHIYNRFVKFKRTTHLTIIFFRLGSIIRLLLPCLTVKVSSPYPRQSTKGDTASYLMYNFFQPVPNL